MACGLCGKNYPKGGCRAYRVKFADGSTAPAPTYEGGWDPGTGLCGDCGVEIGKRHHDNCDVARCPRCDGQLFMGCNCPPDCGPVAFEWMTTTRSATNA